MMLSTLKLRIIQNKTLLIAVFISMALHILLLGKHAISLPANLENISHIQVRLIQSIPEKQIATPYNIEQSPPLPKHSTQNHQDTSAQKTEIPINPTDVSEAINSPITSNEANNPDSLLDSEMTESTEDNTQDTLATASTESTNTHINNAYPYVHTEFEVSRGDDSGMLGITQITFHMNQRNNTYQLTSVTEARGLASLFLKRLEQRSEGNVDEKGLKPNYYAYEYGTNSDKNQYAQLSWADGVIEMTSKKGKKSEALPEGTQDFLSFMYQFMFTPPLNSMQITMTNGKYLRTYTYSFEGEETITTKFGELKTLHLLKSGDNLEKTEIWLALDYQNIPVKVRKTEKNGEVLEQTVTAISTTRPE